MKATPRRARRNHSMGSSRSRARTGRKSVRGKGLFILVLIGVSLCGLFLVSHAVTPAVQDWTRLREIIISGLEHVTRQEVLTRLALPDQVSLLALDLDELTARVEAHPWVADVTFDRMWPSTLAVHVQERRAAAVAQIGNDRWLIDEEGVLLEQGAEPQAALPVFVGLDPRTVNEAAASSRERVREGLHVAALVSEIFPGRPVIDLAHPEIIVAELSGLRFTFGKEIDEQWARFQLLYPTIRNRLIGTPQQIDLRYAQKIILRPQG